MGVVTMAGDELSLHNLVGTSTFLHARRMVTNGEVLRLTCEKQDLGVSVVTAAIGPSADPTDVVAVITRDPEGDLAAVRGTCGCGVPAPCPHTVAAALAAFGAVTAAPAAIRTTSDRSGTAPAAAGRTGPGTGNRPALLPPPPAPPAWAKTLDLALGTTPTKEPARAGQPSVALQFEPIIIAPAPKITRTGSRAGTPARTGPTSKTRTDAEQTSAASATLRIQLRPVRLSDSGNWVRTGISWRSLDYYGFGYGYNYRQPKLTERQTTLLEELSALRSGSSYGDSENTLDLSLVTSRRVWDLLIEVRDAGIPLVWAGRGADPVRLHPQPVRAVVDLVQVRTPSGTGTGTDADTDTGPAGFELRAALMADDRSIPGRWHQLLGSPANGVAWRGSGQPPNAKQPTDLMLAPLESPPDESFLQLHRHGPLPVPAQDLPAFLTDFYPRLRERLVVLSSDHSVVLPTPQPPRLLLSVLLSTVDHRADLHWSWLYQLGENRQERPLAALVDGPGPGRDHNTEQTVLAAVNDQLAQGFPDFTDLLQPAGPAASVAADTGRSLIADTTLIGVTTARFVAEVIPVLQARDDVIVEVTHTQAVPDYRSLTAEPVIDFSGSTAVATTDPGSGTGDTVDRPYPEQPEQQDWFDLSVSITVEGQQIPFEQLFVALARQEPHLLLPDGGYVSLDQESFRHLARLIEESKSLFDAPPATLRLSRFQTSVWEDVEQLGQVSGQAQVWQQTARDLQAALSGTGTGERTPVPADLKADLRPYQVTGFDWLVTVYRHRLGGILADDMGLGKTLQALALILHARTETPTGAPFLIIAPTSVVGTWAAETARFAPTLTVTTVTETETRRGHTLAELAEHSDIMVTSYTLFRLEHEYYRQLPWSGLFLDEAQAIKNHHSAGYRCVRDLPAPFKLAITGTPIENNLMELWSLLSITSPGLFASAARFADLYRAGIERHRDPLVLNQLRQRIRPLMLRRNKQLVAADLPDKQEQVMELELHPRHRLAYGRYLQRERQKVLGLLADLRTNRFEILKSLTLLRQAALDVSLVDPKQSGIPSTKLDVLIEQVRDIAAEGHRVLIFSQFTRFLGSARDRLAQAGLEYCYLDGTTRNRPAVIDRFRTGDAPVFLISLKAGGTGLTLTEADYVILLDPWWNPATEAQAVDRVHRIGQTNKVMVYRLVAKNTIEEKVMALKATKSALISSVLDEGDLASGALTADDIRTLLS